MSVEVLACTPDPLRVVSLAAGTCYGKSDYSEKRVLSCLKAGHMSVFEHVSVTFDVNGISRACSHQLVRHRVASYSQQSQRYCKVDTEGHDWYVVPFAFVQGDAGETLTTLKQARFREAMRNAAEAYNEALGIGIRPEDARYLLPEATKTRIEVTMNARELFHFLDVRDSPRAQWEIRELARSMADALRGIDGWRELIEMRDELAGCAANEEG